MIEMLGYLDWTCLLASCKNSLCAPMGTYLANCRRASVATGALRFFTRRMFRNGEGQCRDKRSWF